MQTNLIIIKDYCDKRNIDAVFFHRLEEEGLIEVQIVEGEKYIDEEQLPDLERYIRWHYDLAVNVEGIDVIRNLLLRIDNLQNEMNELRKRLHLYSGF